MLVRNHNNWTKRQFVHMWEYTIRVRYTIQIMSNKYVPHRCTYSSPQVCILWMTVLNWFGCMAQATKSWGTQIMRKTSQIPALTCIAMYFTHLGWKNCKWNIMLQGPRLKFPLPQCAVPTNLRFQFAEVQAITSPCALRWMMVGWHMG